MHQSNSVFQRGWKLLVVGAVCAGALNATALRAQHIRPTGPGIRIFDPAIWNTSQNFHDENPHKGQPIGTEALWIEALAVDAPVASTSEPSPPGQPTPEMLRIGRLNIQETRLNANASTEQIIHLDRAPDGATLPSIVDIGVKFYTSLAPTAAGYQLKFHYEDARLQSWLGGQPVLLKFELEKTVTLGKDWVCVGGPTHDETVTGPDGKKGTWRVQALLYLRVLAGTAGAKPQP